MNHAADHNPRKQFDESVQYALTVASNYLSLFNSHGINLNGLQYLELGPGADFAPQLVLASHGAKVILADKYLASWDPAFHPEFYKAFLKAWSGRSEAIVSVLNHGGYDQVLTLLPEPAEKLSKVASESIDFVQSNAVLEHVMDVRKVVKELARVTKLGGINSHQIDFRFHKDFQRPLDHLLLDQRTYLNMRNEDKGNHGTALRMPEIIEEFSKYFWVWKTEINALAEKGYVEEVINNLPENSPYKTWPPPLLSVVGGRIWFSRKKKKYIFNIGL